MVKEIYIAILVSKDYSVNPFKDDLLLKKALEERGYKTDIVAWSEEIDFSKYSLVVIRSCWDYDQRVDEFLAKMKFISEDVILLNSYEIIKRNSNKKYLFDLEKRSVDIIPTLLVDDLENIVIPDNWDEVIVKPTVSASGRDTNKFKREDLETIKLACYDIIKKNKEPIIQKYMSAIETNGEYSSIVIDDNVVLNINKKPEEGNYLVHTHFGGSYCLSDITPNRNFFIRNLLDKMDHIPLYMRVDYIEDYDDKVYLMELEEIEPGLYLSENLEAVELLADAILDYLTIIKEIK